MKLATVEIKGRKFDIEVTDRGEFNTTDDGNYIEANSLEELKGKLSKRMARESVRISIPFVRWESDRYNGNGRIKKGNITGIHAANSNLLVKWDGEKGTDQDRSWGNNEYFNPEHGPELERLHKAVVQARAELEKFEKKHGFNGREAVKAALVKAGEIDPTEIEG